MDYDFTALHTKLEQGVKEYEDSGYVTYPEHLRMTNEEMEALFQHFIDTDTLPDDPAYQVYASLMLNYGKLQPRKEN